MSDFKYNVGDLLYHRSNKYFVEVKGINDPFKGMYKLVSLSTKLSVNRNKDVVESNFIKVKDQYTVRVLYGE